MTTGYTTRNKGKAAFARIDVGAGGIHNSGNTLRSVATGLTATGTNAGTALALTAGLNRVSTVAAGTGVALPQSAAGLEVTIFNDGASPLTVYGNSTDTIDGSASVTLTNAKRCMYFCFVAGAWESAQLGVASA